MDQSFYSPSGTATVPATPLPRRLPPLVEHGLPSGFRTTDSTPRLRTEDLRTPSGDPMIGPDGFLIPPARSMATVVGAATRVFSHRFDEAMRDNAVNARAMRRDAFIRGLLEERLLPTINRKWHLVVEDESDPDQKAVRDDLSRIVRATPQFDAFKRALLDGVWFGRAGAQWNNCRNEDVEGFWCIDKWDPVHGDSVQFTFDGTPAILMDGQTAGWYSNHGASWGLNGDLRPTDRGGTALVLHRPYWRDRFAIHQHIREKADFFEGELAGSVQGLGLRGLVYWHYVIRTEVLTWMLTYMQAVGSMDLMVFNYPQGDNEAKLNAEANARKIVGKAALVCPRNPQGTWPAVEQIPMNESGLEALHKLLADYFDRHIERLVVGQSMSAGDDNESGLGGTGRADFAKATKDEILVYDTNRLDETISSDVVAPLKRYNFPWARFPVRYASILPDLDAKDKTANGKIMVDAGVEIKVDEWREAAGFSRPEEGDETVGGQQPGTPPPGTPPPAPGTEPNGPGPMGGAKPPGGPQAAQTYPRRQSAPEPEEPPQPPQNRLPASPTPNDAGSVAPAVGTTPTMGYPGGGNAYIPSFGDTEDERRRPRPMGFTRYEQGHKPAGSSEGGQFTSGSGSRVDSGKELRAVNAKKYGPAVSKPLGLDYLRKKAAATSIVGFLNSLSVEYRPVHADVGVPPFAPSTLTHDIYAPAELQGTEIDDWGEAARKNVVADIQKHIGEGGGIRPILIHGLPEDTAGVDVTDGHHRVAAVHGSNGTKVPASYDAATLARIWKEAHGSEKSVKELLQVYDDYVRRLHGAVRNELGDNPTDYAATHAPAGGVTVAGKKFTGGQFIPAEVMADASPEERAAVELGDARNKPLPPDGGAKLPTGGNRILDAIKSVPARVMASVRERVEFAYAKLETRYGPRYAKAIVAAGLSGLPIPLPGAMAVAAAPVLALAELHRQLRGISAPLHAAADDWTQTPEFAAAVREFRKDCGVAEPARNERGTGPVQYGKFGCLTVPLTGNAAIQILNRAALVRDGDLASDGREDTPHITVR